MIIVLNMLIAMMNNSYQAIADNLAMEHLFSQTKLWLEYVGDEQGRPVPFNLIPSVQRVIWLFKKWKGISKRDTMKIEAEETQRYTTFLKFRKQFVTPCISYRHYKLPILLHHWSIYQSKTKNISFQKDSPLYFLIYLPRI